MKGSKRYRLLTVCLAGAFIVSFSSAEAATGTKRLHDPQVETKVEMQPNQEPEQTKVITPSYGHTVHPGEAEKKDFSARVREILYPPEPVKPISFSSDSILGSPIATQEQCVRYLLRMNPFPNLSVTPERLVSYYYEEGQREGVRPDVAFAQALKETGYFRYGGTVTPDQNNYCGLGTTSATIKGAYFPSPQLGVRAHIQHLLAYASTRRPQEPVVDPRYDLVRMSYGTDTLHRWEDLNGRWAVPGYTYGQSVMQLFGNILQK